MKMAMIAPPITAEEASKAMLDGLTSHIRSALKDRIMARLQPDIDAAIDAGMETFKAAIQSYHEAHNMRDTIRVLIEKR